MNKRRYRGREAWKNELPETKANTSMDFSEDTWSESPPIGFVQGLFLILTTAFFETLNFLGRLVKGK